MPKGSLILAAFVLFFFLFLTPVSPLCRTGTADVCSNSQEYVPGTHLAQLGIDITTLGSKEREVMNLHKWGKTDGSCTVCENPLLQRGQQKHLHRLALAITDWNANISCQQKVQHSVIQSATSLAVGMTEFNVKNDWKKDLVVDVKSSANGRWILVGSQSYPTSFIKERISQDTYIFLLHHVSCSYYKFSINKNMTVSAKFRNAVQDLPEKYDPSSKLKYRYQIEDYGTHVISELELGVRVRILAPLSVCRMAMEGIKVSEISHCLEIQAGQIIDIDNVNKKSELDECIRKALTDPTSRWLSQLRYIEGGEQLNFYSNGIFTASKEWLENVKSKPSLLSYSLEPLHTLLDKRDPRREGLRQAVSDYVKEKAVFMSCHPPCPPGVQLSASDPCSCQCPNDNFTTSMCCPKQRGLANLTVTIQHAEGLWGDYITGTDAYVNMLLNDKILCTSTVWNNNNPKWNASFDFGILQVTDVLKLEIQVWDEDFGWNDDVLGRCILPLKPWDPTQEFILQFKKFSHECPLNHGSLHLKYRLDCGPNLGGPSCMDYVTLRPKKSVFGQIQWDR